MKRIRGRRLALLLTSALPLLAEEESSQGLSGDETIGALRNQVAPEHVESKGPLHWTLLDPAFDESVTTNLTAAILDDLFFWSVVPSTTTSTFLWDISPPIRPPFEGWGNDSWWNSLAEQERREKQQQLQFQQRGRRPKKQRKNYQLI